MAVAFQVSEVVAMADHLKEAAQVAPDRLQPSFAEWVDETYDIMQDEMPELTGELKESTTVEWDGPLSATIGPTNTDDAGRPIGFFVNYGAGNRDPDDFIDRTAMRSGEAASAWRPDIEALL